MIVPKYWAEARQKRTIHSKPATLKRFGWSNSSQEEAQRHAEQRLQQAFAALQQGKALKRLEPKVAYNGADGVPIREEIIESYPEAVITRNSYGALCLNTPDVLFADIDCPMTYQLRDYMPAYGVFLLMAGVLGGYWQSIWVFLGAAFVALFFVSWLIGRVFKSKQEKGELKQRALAKIRSFSEGKPDWHLRVYETPAGFRVLVMHQLFEPRGEDVEGFFAALDVDPVYARMCRQQNCFRARISPKPWRMGLDNIKPRGVWPQTKAAQDQRAIWVRHYEAHARKFAACRFVQRLGSQKVDSKARHVQNLHDKNCRAMARLPFA